MNKQLTYLLICFAVCVSFPDLEICSYHYRFTEKQIGEAYNMIPDDCRESVNRINWYDRWVRRSSGLYYKDFVGRAWLNRKVIEMNEIGDYKDTLLHECGHIVLNTRNEDHANRYMSEYLQI